MEFIARITLEDGSVAEHVVNVEGGVPGLSDADFSSIDAVKRTIAAYEKPTIAAGSKLLEEVANGHMERLSKKKSSISWSAIICDSVWPKCVCDSFYTINVKNLLIPSL